MSGDYEVGRGKPPLESRFKPGMSGNPKGRPKGSRSTSSVLLGVMREKIVITVGGRRRSITKLEAAALQLANKAAAGDARAIKHLFDLSQTAEADERASATGRLSAAARDARDQHLMEEVKRLAWGDDDPTDPEDPKDPKDEGGSGT